MNSVKTNAKKKASQEGGLGLSVLGDLSSLLDEPQTANASLRGGPQELSLDLIDEDPCQPRTTENPGFSPKSIAEIGETIKTRGVKSPISVRENKNMPGRYLINHGARRYRGSKWAGKTTIPAFIDNDYNETDQVIENLQRNELTAREIADFIGRELAKGKKKSEVAKEIGKSPAFVTQHVTLLDLPEPIAKAFNAGRCNDVTVINELVVAYKKYPEAVLVWLEGKNQEMTRGLVKKWRGLLEEELSQNSAHDPTTIDTFTSEMDGRVEGGDRQFHNEAAREKKRLNKPDPDKLKKVVVQVKHSGRLARLVLDRRPPGEGLAWLRCEDDGQEFEADLGVVQLVALLEG